MRWGQQMKEVRGCRGMAWAVALSPPHKQRIQLFERDLLPGGAAMVALIGAFGAFHIAQQGVHLG